MRARYEGDTDQHQVDILTRNLPRLREHHRADLDSVLSLEELTAAVQQMTSGRAPGVDLELGGLQGGLGGFFINNRYPKGQETSNGE